MRFVSETPEFQGTDRFVVRRRIGTGGMGLVYRAFDRERGADVALKVMRKLDAAALLRFKREFRALSDVSHPNLVSLHELVSTDDHWFFTMELVEGVDFLEYVRGGFDSASEADTLIEPQGLVPRSAAADSRPSASTNTTAYSNAMSASGEMFVPMGIDPRGSMPGYDQVFDPLRDPAQFARLRDALRQLAVGVDALHRAGMLHRDLKPSNVLVTNEGRVVILDFGIVADLAPRRWSRTDSAAGRLVGTPAYMAPEQAAAGDSIDEAADWYAMGVMTYEAMCGRRPFPGRRRDVITLKLGDEPPPPPVAIAPWIPDDLDRLVVGLLAREPGDRPSCRHILELLGASPDAPTGGALQASALGSYADVLIGRDKQLADLRSAYLDTRAGSFRAALVHGESGMGKSALVEHFLSELEDDREAVLLSGRCYERESVPFKALDSLLDGLARFLYELSQSEARSLVPRHCGALVRLFPVLRRVEAFNEAARRDDEAQDPHELRLRGFEALRSLLRRLCRTRPLVLHIDDGQWADADSATLLSSVLREPQLPLLLVVGYRSEHSDTSPFLRVVRTTLPHASTVAVEPLADDESRALAVTLLRQRGMLEADRDADAIARESSGNPFFVNALATYVTSPGEAGNREEFRDVVTFDEMLRETVDRLSSEARELLEIVAFAGHPIPTRVAARAAQVDKRAAGAVAALRSASLIRTGGERSREWIECYHDRIREAVVASVEALRSRERHAALAACLGAEPGVDPQTLAVHCEGAGQLDRAAQLYLEAADQSANNLAFDRAIALYQRALDLRPLSGPELASVQLRLADAQVHAGRGLDAARSYLAAAAHADPATALRCRSRAAEEMLRCGRIDEGLALFEELLSTVDIYLPRTRGATLRMLLGGRLRLKLRGTRFSARDASELSDVERTRLNLLRTSSGVLAMTDNTLGTAFQTRHLLEALRLGERVHVAEALGMESAITALGGRKNRARAIELSEQAADLSRRAGEPVALGTAQFARAMTDFQCGYWRTGRSLAEQAVQTLRTQCADYGFGASSAEVVYLWGVNYMGDLGELRQRVLRLLREGEARGDLYLVTNVSIGVPNTSWLLFGEEDEARRRNRDAVARWSRRNYHLQHYWGALGEVHADLYEGQVDRACERMSKEIPTLKRAYFFRIALMRAQIFQLVARCNLAVAESGSDRASHLRAAARDARRLAADPHTLSETCAPLQAAGVACLRGDLDQAAILLRRAIDTGERHEMMFHVNVARFHLGRLIGGAEGDALKTTGNDYMRGEGMADPSAAARFLAPGFDRLG